MAGVVALLVLGSFGLVFLMIGARALGWLDDDPDFDRFAMARLGFWPHGLLACGAALVWCFAGFGYGLATLYIGLLASGLVVSIYVRLRPRSGGANEGWKELFSLYGRPSWRIPLGAPRAIGAGLIGGQLVDLGAWLTSRGVSIRAPAFPDGRLLIPWGDISRITWGQLFEEGSEQWARDVAYLYLWQSPKTPLTIPWSPRMTDYVEAEVPSVGIERHF